MKKTIAQAVFDSPETKRMRARGHAQACDELARTPRSMLDRGNPNHPDYDLHIFGEYYQSFMQRQYK